MNEFIRVAIYIRCAIEEICNQVELLTEFVSKQENCVLASVYVDEGHEKQKFKEMMQDATLGKIDCVVTKDTTRFSRYLPDLIRDIHTLKDSSVDVVFLENDIDTRDAYAELKIAISTPMIKEESCKMRERIKHGCGMQRKETEGCHYE
jgi:DNA invertase Pin-like site-specific DNA recombinase